MFFFSKHPKILYDIQKNNKPITVQNPLVRYKLLDILKPKTTLYYSYTVRDGQTPQFIAHRYYGDETLDWVIFVVNDVIDPQYDWPLNYDDLLNFIRNKYGSIETAMSTVHHYEQIVQTSSVLFDETVVPEIVVQVDSTTYNSLPASERRSVDSFEYETNVNDNKRKIKVLHKDFLTRFLNEAQSVF